MENPWIALPESAPFVLERDWPYIEAFHRHEPPERHFRVDLPPDPWIGRWDAPIVILLQNPSFDESDTDFMTRDDVLRANRQNLTGTTPHYWLRPELAAGYSGRWWRRTLGPLIASAGLERVARSVAAIELYGYRTRTFRALPITLPSQEFSLQLVRDAIERDAWLVLPRAAPLWEVALPRLFGYPRLVRGKSRNAILSVGNLHGDGFGHLLGELAN